MAGVDPTSYLPAEKEYTRDSQFNNKMFLGFHISRDVIHCNEDERRRELRRTSPHHHMGGGGVVFVCFFQLFLKNYFLSIIFTHEH